MADKKDKKTKRPTALKRDIRNNKQRMVNKEFKSQVRTAIRSFEASLAAKDAAAGKEQLNTVYSMMDKGVKRGIFKPNKASRTKQRFAARLAATVA